MGFLCTLFYVKQMTGEDLSYSTGEKKIKVQCAYKTYLFFFLLTYNDLILNIVISLVTFADKCSN